MFKTLFTGSTNPTIVKNITDSTKPGIVVISIYLIWVYRSTPATDAERLVVSERGDILSPKYAPDITAPASQGAGNPNI